jgi:ABC-type transport system involved in cytochrome bd biosynthesis fused ATPase/permease subunit
MWLIATAEISCIAAGVLMIILGFILTWREINLRKNIHDEARNTSATLREASTKIIELHKSVQAKTISADELKAALPSASDYVNSLAKLAKSLSGLNAAIASFIVATILFFFAMLLGTINYTVK